MKKYTIMFLCLTALLFSAVCPGVYGQGLDEDLKAKVESMEKMLMELKGELKQQTEATDELMAMRDEISKISAPTLPEDDFYWAKKSQELVDKGLAPVFGRQYGKPFLRRFGRNTYIGGYMDHELRFEENGNHTFDQHRLIPFIYSDVSDRVKFATEIEFEHGGTDSPGGVQGKSGEMKIEFATIDFLMTDWLNYRGGIILSPLGKYNLVHDSPLQDLTDRPMVNRRIIPTTLSESGMGFFGTFYPTELSKIDYEIYAVNGFSAQDGTDIASGENFIRSSRGSIKDNNNRNFAIVGRLAISPFLGLEIGLSAHSGYIDNSDSNRMTIKAVDWTYQRGAFELVGEYAHSSIEREGSFVDKEGNISANSDKYNGDSWGYYIEPRYHFMPQFLKDHAPTFFTENSTFTAVARLGGTDINQPLNEEGNLRRTRLTTGLNFRYTEDTVFKAEYQVNWENGRGLPSENNNNLVFSVATYF
jgi:hypothetical protein